MLKEIRVEQKMIIEVDGVDVKVLSVSSKVIGERMLGELYTDTHSLSSSELRYGIITLGKNNNIGRVLPKGAQITLFLEHMKNEEGISLNTHKTSIGRIDGLTKIFRDNAQFFSESQLYKLIFNIKNNQLSINKV